MEDKEVEKIQTKRKSLDIAIFVMSAIFIVLGIVYLVIDNNVSRLASFIYLMCWLVYAGAFIFVWIIARVSVNKKEKCVRINNYSFDREEKSEQTITNFEAINNNENVIFNRKKLRFAGAEFAYDELIFDYITYGDNILLHIYTKDNDEKPLLIFVVTKDFYHCMKFFKINIEKLDKEIDMFNLNFKK